MSYVLHESEGAGSQSWMTSDILEQIKERDKFLGMRRSLQTIL